MPVDHRIPASRAVSRRGFLGRAGGAALAAVPAVRLLAAPADGPRRLSFQHTHTGEHLSVVYFQSGSYVPAALANVDVLLRDFRTDTVHPIDPQLLDVLHAL